MKTEKLNYTLVLIVMAMAIAMFVFSIMNNSARVALGSTLTGQDYMATTTAASNGYGSVTGSAVIKTGSGAFGSLVITGANTGIMNFYDATTSDVTKRTLNRASSSILIASVPASMVAGDYVFDIALSSGLYVDLVSGNMPTTTITFRN